MSDDARFYGQFGEDRMLATIFAKQTPRVCVDVGANDGETGSVSLHFERLGWRCVLVEPNPDLCAILRSKRDAFVFEGAASSREGTATLVIAEGDPLSHAASSIEPGSEKSIARQGFSARNVTVQTERLDTILVQASVTPGELAFVSIDVEGHELDVLKGFSLARWRPDVLIVEDNSLLFGNGVKDLVAKDGYIRFRRTGVNDWYASPAVIGAMSRSPRKEYRQTMLRARALMMRRQLIGRLVALPVVGPKIRQLIHSIWRAKGE